MLRKCRITAAMVGGLLAPSLFAADDAPAKKSKHQPKPATAVETIAERQIHNAIDAGEGDILTRSLRQKVVEEPSNVEARLALGAAYERQGAPELAIEHYRIAAVEYGSETAASRLAKTLDGLGESEQAVEMLVRYCDSHPQASSRILSELAILEDELDNLAMGEHYHAAALTAALRQNALGQDSLHSNLGYNLIRQKRFTEAEFELRAAIELNPGSEVARNNLALALASPAAATSAQVSEAILQWQSLSGPAAAHNNLAAVYLEQKRYPEARRELVVALEYDRANRPALKNLAWLSALDGKPAQLPPAAAKPVQLAQRQKTSRPNLFKRLFVRTTRTEQSIVAPEVASAAKPRRKPHRNQNQQ